MSIQVGQPVATGAESLPAGHRGPNFSHWQEKATGMDTEENQNLEHVELVIDSRPMIQVYLNRGGEVVVSVTGLDASLERVDSNYVCIPVDCCEDVGKALLAIADANKG
ncbi:hypothetical protein [Burkholderia gladioli]|uniref:hypothetical protein n=1 Tax=Burkholderia gladioli TaxID=28095 RepID=UPI003D362868